MSEIISLYESVGGGWVIYLPRAYRVIVLRLLWKVADALNMYYEGMSLAEIRRSFI